jgi:hypothetical protein
LTASLEQRNTVAIRTYGFKERIKSDAMSKVISLQMLLYHQTMPQPLLRRGAFAQKQSGTLPICRLCHRDPYLRASPMMKTLRANFLHAQTSCQVGCSRLILTFHLQWSKHLPYNINHLLWITFCLTMISGKKLLKFLNVYTEDRRNWMFI